MRTRTTLTLILCLLSVALIAQDPVPDKGSGILYFSGKPASTPIESISSEYAYDMNTGKVYTWSRDSSDWYPYPDITHSFAAPSGDPGTDSKLHIDRTNGNLYQWDGDSWEQIIGGGASTAALADTSAAIRADALELPDTASTVSTKYYADLFNDDLAGRGTTTKQSFLDSLAGFQSFADIASIQAASPRVGYRLEDRRTGVRYKVQSDSIAGYAVDDSLVIDLSGRYAVADLSEKRAFRTIDEFKRESPLLKIDNASNRIKVGSREMLITYSPEITTIGDWSYEDTIVDGLFLDTINVDFEGENIYRSSEYFYHNRSVGGSNVITYSGTVRPNYGVSPDEKRTSTAIVGNNTVYPFINQSDYDNTSEYIFSIFIKNTHVTDQYSISAGGETTVVDTSNHDWKRYHVVMPALMSTPSFVGFNFPGLNPTDTVEIWGWQLEINDGTDQPSSYKKTQFDISAKSGRMYINRGASLLDNGVLRLDWLDDYTYYLTRRSYSDHAFFQKAIDYCDEGKRCNEVRLKKGSYLIREPVVWRDNIRMSGSPVLRDAIGVTDLTNIGTEIRVLLSDTTETAFQFDVYGGSQTIKGAGISNVSIVPVGDVHKVISMTECNGCVFENINIEAENSGSFNFGIDINTQVSSDSYWNDFRNIYISDPDSTGIEYSGSTDNQFNRIVIDNANIGIHVVEGNKFVGNGLMLQHCITSLRIDAGNVIGSELYTEGSGGGNGVIIQNGGSLSIYNSTIQVDDSATDTVLNISGGSWFSMQNSTIRSGSIVKATGINSMDFQNVESTFALANIPISNSVRKKLRVKNNPKYNSSEIFPDYDYSSRLVNLLAERSSIRNSSIADTMYYNNVIAMASGSNSLIYSDTLDADTLIHSSDTVAIAFANNFQSPQDGNTDVTTLVVRDNRLNGAGSVAWFGRSGDVTFQPGDTYAFSVFVYNHGGSDISGDLLLIRPGSSVNNEATLRGLFPSQEWARISVIGEIETSGSGVDVRLAQNSIPDGDSISLWGIQLEIGDKMTTYLSTDASGVSLSNPTEIIPSGKKKVYSGDVEVTGELYAEKYRSFTPIVYDNSDTLLVDRLELGFDNLKITDELDGLEVKQVTFTTDRDVTADTGVRLEYFDISGSSYTVFGSGTILNGTNQITVTGLSQSVEAGDIIYMEITSTGGEANGISANVKFQ